VCARPWVDVRLIVVSDLCSNDSSLCPLRAGTSLTKESEPRRERNCVFRIVLVWLVGERVGVFTMA
jgi:hypothetical protein